MDFNIRAISLVEGVPTGARIDIERNILGKEIFFRAGLSYSIKLPDDIGKFGQIQEPERLLTALGGWAPVYVYPDGDVEKIHVLAPSETADDDLAFYRLDFQQKQKSRRGPRPRAELIGGAVLGYEECATWLMDLATSWRADAARRNLRFVVSRSCTIKLNQMRLAWVVPEIVEDESVRERLLAIGAVYGVDIVHVPPRQYDDTKGRLARSLPYNAAVICTHFAPHINAEAVPTVVPRDLIHLCNSARLEDLESQIRVWIEVVAEELESRRKYESVDEEEFLLALMVQKMVSHSKIGEFSHCPKETVLKVIRARHLNVPAAERVLDQNTEQHESTKTSASLFLWKGHHDGRQYFLNPKRMAEIKPLAVG